MAKVATWLTFGHLYLGEFIYKIFDTKKGTAGLQTVKISALRDIGKWVIMEAKIGPAHWPTFGRHFGQQRMLRCQNFLFLNVSDHSKDIKIWDPNPHW